MIRSIAIVTVLLTLIVGCSRQEPDRTVIVSPPEDDGAPADNVQEAPAAELQVTSTAFEDGARIPDRYTADGENISPPLSFGGVPEDAVELVLICHDPDAPREGGWTHWVAYGMAPDISGLPEAVPTQPRVSEPGVTQGENSWGDIGYGGPDPPRGKPHRYQFMLYAVDAPLNLQPGATRADVEAAMEGKVVAEGLLEGLYGR